jgi:hypothetical protein
VSLDIANITFDCHDAKALGDFWSAALDRPVGDMHSQEITILPGRPRLFFLAVPESKTAKNRVHLDLVADDRDAEVSRLVSLGATEVREVDEHGLSWTVLHDPEGNELCVAQGPSEGEGTSGGKSEADAG